MNILLIYKFFLGSNNSIYPIDEWGQSRLKQEGQFEMQFECGVWVRRERSNSVFVFHNSRTTRPYWNSNLHTLHSFLKLARTSYSKWNSNLLLSQIPNQHIRNFWKFFSTRVKVGIEFIAYYQFIFQQIKYCNKRAWICLIHFSCIEDSFQRENSREWFRLIFRGQ